MRHDKDIAELGGLVEGLSNIITSSHLTVRQFDLEKFHNHLLDIATRGIKFKKRSSPIGLYHRLFFHNTFQVTYFSYFGSCIGVFCRAFGIVWSVAFVRLLEVTCIFEKFCRIKDGLRLQNRAQTTYKTDRAKLSAFASSKSPEWSKCDNYKNIHVPLFIISITYLSSFFIVYCSESQANCWGPRMQLLGNQGCSFSSLWCLQPVPRRENSLWKVEASIGRFYINVAFSRSQ